MRIGVFTFHRANNYGAVLQAAAFQRYIGKSHAECEIIDYYPNNAIPARSAALRSAAKCAVDTLRGRGGMEAFIKEKRFEGFRKRNLVLSHDKYLGDCFNGEPKFILVCRNRFGKGGMTEDFFTTEWEHIPVARPDHPNSAEPVEKTELLDEMLRISRILSAGIPFVRVDLYAANGQIYFGELTFFPASGAKPFLPETYDRIFGDMLELPARNTETGEEK